MMEGMTDPEPTPAITEDDVELMEQPDEHFDPDAPPATIDRQQAEDADVAVRDAVWINPRERVGGD